MRRLLRTVISTLLAMLVLPVLLVVLISILPFVFVPTIYRRYRLLTNNHPIRWVKARLGWGYGVPELARRLDVSPFELEATVPVYRCVSIAKRSGGARRLSVPDRRTRDLQRRLLRRVFARLSAHPAARGFEHGRSIVDNARPHVGQAVVIRLDMIDFFANTSAERVEWYFRRIGWNKEAAALLTRLTTHEGGLPQGAPTSPRLSNLVNYMIDVKLAKLAARRGGVYTRYADDITFSLPRDHPRKARGMVQSAARILKSSGYSIHRRRKLSIRRRHQRQTVTGLVVNDGIQLPRSKRRWLRSVRHHVKTGRPATLTPEQLQGWTALETMVAQQRTANSSGSRKLAPRSQVQ